MNGAQIYVASLSDYNAGRLHGEWIDADQSAEEIQAAVSAMLAESKEFIAEEWAIHDYEGFAGLRIEEYDSFERVAMLAELVEEHGEAFALWYDWQTWSEDDDLGEMFQEHYCGSANSEEEYVEQWHEDCGYEIPDWLRCHVDWESVAREFQMDYYMPRASDGTVHVFRQ